jgi:serine/threonine protein kinase
LFSLHLSLLSSDFRFLVIERMEHDFFSLVLLLMQGLANNNDDSGFLNVAPIALRLLEMVQFFHSIGHVLIDVKPDNIMLAYESDDDDKKKKKKTDLSTASLLADRLRILDFGLVQWFHTNGDHKENILSDGSCLVGTPLYSSRHVHAGNTPSRRDDMEAMGLVISELIIRLQAEVDGTTQEFSSTRIPSYLPWAMEPSTKAIGKVKAEMMADANSVFYKRMGCPTVAQTMFRYFDMTHSLQYTKQPKYEDFETLLRGLTLPVKVATKRPHSRAPAATAKPTPSKKVKHAATADSPAPKLKTVPFVPGAAKNSPMRTPDKKKKKAAGVDDLSATDGVSSTKSPSSSQVKPKTIPYQPPVAAKAESKARSKTPVASASTGKPSSSSSQAKVKTVPYQPPAATKSPLKEKTTASRKETNQTDSKYAPKPRRAKVPCHYGVLDESDSSGDEMEEDAEMHDQEMEDVQQDDWSVVDGDDEDIENDEPTENVAPMDVDDQPRASKNDSSLTLRVVGGPHQHQNIKLTLTKAHDSVFIGTGRRSKTSKPNETMLVLDKDTDIAETHCKMVFYVTRGGTPRIVLTARAGGIIVGTEPVAIGGTAHVWPGTVICIGPQTVISVN